MSTLSQFFGGSTTGVPVELLVVAGGGGTTTASSASRPTGGGGAGELVYCKDLLLPVGVPYTITVGGGGSVNSGNGSNSAFGNLLAGGGGGGGGQNGALPLVGTQGLPGRRGSGGGASADSTREANGAPGPGSVFTGNPLGTAQYQVFGANSGGGSIISPAVCAGGGGGSGTAAPTPRVPITFPTGGAGTSINITGAAVTYAAGGAVSVIYAPGDANTGNGAGGGINVPGAAGGSGVVIIAYPNTYPVPASITGTYNEPTRSGWRVYRFTASGSITL